MKIAVFALTLLATFTGATFAQVKPKADIVYINSRGEQKTEEGAYVNEWTWSGLDVKMKSGQRRFGSDEVISVTFTRPPTGFEDATDSFKGGDYRTAIESFMNLLESGLKDSELWAAEQAHYYLWASYRGLGAYDDARSEMTALKKDFPKSSFLPEIILQEAEDIYGLGDYAKADAAFSAVSDQARTQNWQTKFRIMADFGRVRSLMESGKVKDADSLFAQISGSIAAEDMRQRSQVIKGQLLVANGKIDEAMSHYTRLFDGVKANWKAQPMVFAGAANGLGDCYFEKGDWLKATHEYSKTFALFDRDSKLENEVSWALWRFANASKQMAAKEKDAELAREYRGRYERLRRRVAQDYRLTRSGQLSRRELGVAE